MTTFSNHPKLGYGIFTVADVASILDLSKEKVRRWLKEYWDLQLVPEAADKNSWGEHRDKSINFYVLVEFYVFYELRRHKVPVNRIIKAHKLLGERFNNPYPFASNRIMTDGRNILFSNDEGESIVDADAAMQFNLREIIEDFLTKIDFDSEQQIARRLYPAGKSKRIVVDPDHQFGQPVVTGTNILTSTIYALHKGGEKANFIASLYGISKSAVTDAIKFHKHAA
jgi:uncharacterized protein (DUF433 family)